MTRAGIGRLSMALVTSVGLSGLAASAQSQGNRYSAALEPGQEVPALSTPATGQIVLDIDEAAGEIHYELSYSNLPDVRQAHIHFGQTGVSGGIMLWLCKTATNPGPAGNTLPLCTSDSATISGTLVSTDVLAVQRLSAGDFGNAVKQIRLGLAYANVHTGDSPGGEIRGQLKAGGARK